MTAGGVEIDGFDYTTAAVGQSTYLVGMHGAGPPVLLLHGFPQNQYCWHLVAPALNRRRTVVVCDLKGYGASRAPAGGPLGEGYTKREMAAELVDVMARAGFERFAVVGHDRGARVAYRMALDHPDSVECLCVLNIVPTVDQFERMAAEPRLDYYPWFFLAQPPPFAERLVSASAEYFLRHTLEDWTAASGAIDGDAVDRYLSTFTPEVIAAMCADQRAAFHLDRQMDAGDRAAGRRIQCPVLVHWGAEDMADPIPVWRRWAGDVRGGSLPGGHFIPEEAADELVASLDTFLRAT
ncbi:MAG TPA: alpha/beta hydrolase [Gaiellales bacterium]|nr:alpha/beta hydrolase [Gaiellales bacterium]